MATIEYMETDERDLDLIKPLWEQLNEHHRKLSPHFSSHYEAFTFERRKDGLLHKTRDGLMHICLAKDADSGICVGYSVSSLLNDGGHPVGEVESIYVDGPYRAKGIGDALMRKALEWMDTHGAATKKVSVGAGNEDVLPFYARYGFCVRTTTLEQIK
ncbi:MAG TPA: GNAT family N-acetyltransferase [Methanocella sp.]|nr:GNAT family N-acetyltransferase [Methanocella sp.]